MDLVLTKEIAFVIIVGIVGTPIIIGLFYIFHTLNKATDYYDNPQKKPEFRYTD